MSSLFLYIALLRGPRSDPFSRLNDEILVFGREYLYAFLCCKLEFPDQMNDFDYLVGKNEIFPWVNAK